MGRLKETITTLKKYRFRKVFFVVDGKTVFDIKDRFVPCFKTLQGATENCTDRVHYHEIPTYQKPGQIIPNLKVESFYLVHESLFDDILKAHAMDTGEAT